MGGGLLLLDLISQRHHYTPFIDKQWKRLCRFLFYKVFQFLIFFIGSAASICNSLLWRNINRYLHFLSDKGFKGTAGSRKCKENKWWDTTWNDLWLVKYSGEPTEAGVLSWSQLMEVGKKEKDTQLGIQ